MHDCEIIESSAGLREAFGVLRKGYPDLPLRQQAHGKEFRDAAAVIMRGLAEATLASIGEPDKARIVVLMPWRSGLAFADAYRLSGVGRFYHLSSKRDEKTLATIVDYEHGDMREGDAVVIADPMLATGGTLVDAIGRIMQKGVQPGRIVVNAVVAAPAGIAKVKGLYPDVRVIVGALDEKLDDRGYIVPGLGDFGDKYFADLSDEEVRELAAQFHLPASAEEKLVARIERHRSDCPFRT